MAEMDEYRPKDWVAVEIEVGKYIFSVEVKRCTFRNTDKEKPYMTIVFQVLEGDKEGFEFDDNVYITKKAEWRAQYFLRKFDYPIELLEKKPPVLKKAQIEGLRGKIYVDITKDNFDMLKIEVKKFDHLNGHDIENELAKEAAKQEQLPLSDSEPTQEIDLNADLSAEDTTATQQQESVVGHDHVDDEGSEEEPDLTSLD
jgi:hypothetical protein